VAESKILADRVKPKTVDAYIALFPPEDQEALQQIRSALRDALPGSEEVISYNQPLVKQDGVVMFYAAFAKHYSLFIPAMDVVLGEFGEELAAFKVEKATVRLAKGKPLPLELIRRVAVFVAAENAKAKEG
jgi:uncharacterized protein YdhG (YjbR/CyaY superfamily)